jgi:hypothetical protein
MFANTAMVRELLNVALSDEELETFCFDHFRTVHDKFAGDMSRSRKIQLLVEHCTRHDQFDELLNQVIIINPTQYRNFIYRQEIRGMRCFLSYSFREEDKDVAAWFQDFLSAFPDMEIIEARHRPLPVAEQVEQCIRLSDFVCAIVTRRGEGVPPAILEEIEKAHLKKRLIIAFVEDGIPARSLGNLPLITEFKTFQRNTLGSAAPGYLRYIYNTRVEVLRKLRLDRATMRNEINRLSFAFETEQAQRLRLDDL